MPEKEQIKTPHKKSRLVFSITSWFFAVIFLILFIFSLFFQAPWKIIVLLGIFLAALTVLPRPYRKWFWGCVGLTAIVLVIWVFLPDDNEDWRPYTFDEDAAALNAKYAVPDEENAAIIYNQLPEIFEDPCVAFIFEDYNAVDIGGRKPWSYKDYQEYAEWLDNHQEIIELLLKTTQYEKCYFGAKADIMFDDSQTRLFRPCRNAVRLLCFAANYDIGRGKLDDALAKYEAVIYIADHFQQNPETVNKLIGMAIEALGIDGLKHLIINHNVTSEQIGQSEKILARINFSWDKNFTQIIEYEKLYSKNFIALYYEINSQGRIRFNRDPWRRWRDEYRRMLENNSTEKENIKDIHESINQWYKSIAYPSYWQKKLWKANTLLLWLLFPPNPETAGQIINEEFQPFYEMLEPDYDWHQKTSKPNPLFCWPHFTYTYMQLNYRHFIRNAAKANADSYSKTYNLYLRLEADKRGTLLLAAIKRYKDNNGSWPSDLSQIAELTANENLIDRRSEGPFMYKTTQDGFMLYSIGPNKIDEKGNRHEPADDWPIWPPSGDPIWEKEPPPTTSEN